LEEDSSLLNQRMGIFNYPVCKDLAEAMTKVNEHFELKD
jgi:hypothetical protein